jgi:hypothetical protein
MWDYPPAEGIEPIASSLGRLLETISEMLFFQNVNFTSSSEPELDIGFWRTPGRMLVVAVSLAERGQSISLAIDIPHVLEHNLTMHASITDDTVNLESYGSGLWVFKMGS